MPVDAIQLAHQGYAELHHDANVGALPLQVLRDRALSVGPRRVTARLPASTVLGGRSEHPDLPFHPAGPQERPLAARGSCGGGPRTCAHTADPPSQVRAWEGPPLK